ncbi:MAG: AbrB/MazE/SpoVT family DNA-binding domain-containing protein [Halobacteria archaeon]
MSHFRTKTLRIGNSLGVLIPREIVRQENLRPGEPVQLRIVSKERARAVEEVFGIFRGSRGFARLDRLERRLPAGKGRPLRGS